MRLTLLFDLDGTLIDSIELIQNSRAYAFAACGLPTPTDREWLAWIGTPLRTTFAHFADDAHTDRLLAAYRDYQLLNHDRLVHTYNGVPQTLGALHASGYPMGIVTSKSVELAERALHLIGVRHFLDVIIGHDSTVHHKPHPEPVLAALDQLNGRGDRAIFVGDSVHDMHSGNAAGVATVAALWGPFTRDELALATPRYYLDRIAELPALAARLDANETRPDPQA